MWPLDVVFEYLNHRTINASKDPPIQEQEHEHEREPVTHIAMTSEAELDVTGVIEEDVDYDGLYMPFLTEGETPLVDQDKLVEEINLLLSQYTPNTIEPMLDPCHLPLERHTVLTTPLSTGKNTPQTASPTHSETNSEHNVEVLDVTNVTDDAAELRRKPTIRLVTPISPKGPRPLLRRKLPRKPVPSFEKPSSRTSSFALFNRNRPLPLPPAPLRGLPQGSPSTKGRTMKRVYVGKRDTYPSIASMVVGLG
ncbi:hypothetical protein QCA50_014175 [Cerrena zonata]|uniref:Uncharacterized protein n=1 Tax=Cerrena zonata TaxID=2478898 RepID=A0AAW0FPX0_9APHY